MAVKRAKTSRRPQAAGAAASAASPRRRGTAAKTAAGKAAGRSAGKAVAPRKAPASKAPAKKKTATRKKPTPTPPSSAADARVIKVVAGALDEMKALDVKVLDVHGLTDITDTMIIASGTSDRHVRSIADRVIEHAKKAGFRPMGVEGERDGEWVLVDLQDVIVHIMLPRVREFYRLENLWDVSAARRELAERSA